MLRRAAPLPDWLAAVRGARTTSDVPAGYAAGWTFDAPVVEMPVYLRWLADRVEACGGTLTRMALAALPDRAEVVVDAAGLGARLLAHDPDVVPVRGQVVYVEQVGLDRWWLDEAAPTYVVPRSEDIVVGGTEEHGQWDRTPDPRVADELLRRAVALVPELRGARVLGHRVGLRPARPAVRLEEAAARAGDPARALLRPRRVRVTRLVGVRGGGRGAGRRRLTRALGGAARGGDPSDMPKTNKDGSRKSKLPLDDRPVGEEGAATFAKTYDSAEESYGEGERAARTAFSALKHTHEKVGDHWEPKDGKGPPTTTRPRAGARRSRPRRGWTRTRASSTCTTWRSASTSPGRSRMSKDELVEAIKKANRRASSDALSRD